jgi:hypothetical protein
MTNIEKEGRGEPEKRESIGELVARYEAELNSIRAEDLEQHREMSREYVRLINKGDYATQHLVLGRKPAEYMTKEDYERYTQLKPLMDTWLQRARELPLRLLHDLKQLPKFDFEFQGEEEQGTSPGQPNMIVRRFAGRLGDRYEVFLNIRRSVMPRESREWFEQYDFGIQPQARDPEEGYWWVDFHTTTGADNSGVTGVTIPKNVQAEQIHQELAVLASQAEKSS